tara:strand:- start:1176 stop:2012 length:837 start_codon:yes stop_codon:yes gene_type:complete
MHPGNEGLDKWRDHHTGIINITAPSTEAAKKWQGYGTALKPALEPWVLCRKPMASTVAANVLQWGTGALNIDAARYGYGDRAWPGPDASLEVIQARSSPNVRSGRLVDGCVATSYRIDQTGIGPAGNPLGRWPANVYHCPKTSRAEREAGCHHLPARTGAEAVDRDEDSDGMASPRAGAGRTANDIHNHHPTLKPIALMAWLCRLVTPTGGVILDPFAGSGSCGAAAVPQGFRYIGAELEADYALIAEARISHHAGLFGIQQRGVSDVLSQHTKEPTP